VKSALRYLAQAALYGAFAAFIGYFSTAPAYSPIPAGHALLRLSLTHPAQRKAPCRERTPEELAKLPPNMRAPTECTRERADVVIQLDMDGQPLYRRIVPPSGMAKDGAANVYHRLPLPAGPHRFDVRMSDGPDGRFNIVSGASVTLQSGQVLLIDFDPGLAQFVFRH
jgi:hypothetical protein